MHGFQVESVGRRTVGAAAVGEARGLIEQGGHFLEGHAALGDVDGAADEEADHFVEKAIAGEGEAEAVFDR